MERFQPGAERSRPGLSRMDRWAAREQRRADAGLDRDRENARRANEIAALRRQIPAEPVRSPDGCGVTFELVDVDRRYAR